MKNVLTLCLLIWALNSNASNTELKVEPPNWWAGMNTNHVQLMIYGENVSELSPRVLSSSVVLESTLKTENLNYIFLNLHIPESNTGEIFKIEFLKKKKVKQSITYEIKARQENSHLIKGFDGSDVMYLITPDRYSNGNTENDDVSGMLESSNRQDPGGRHGGDISGITNHLDYIANLGFTAIWLNPIIENDMEKWSYHGYAATDFYKVDKRFGSNEEYKSFISLAKQKGIKVIMDMIMNHCGSEHWFVKDPPCSDWLNNQGNYTNTSHRRTTLQDIHAATADKEEFSNGWFVPTMPDLNQKNDLMSTYLIQNTLWWIEYSGISGIRMDTYPYPDKNFMTDWTCAVMNEYPNFSIVGEEWTTNVPTVAYWQAGKVNHDGYTSCLPSVMDFPLQNALTNALKNSESWGEGLIEAYRTLSNDYLYADPYSLVIFPDNHDMDRISTQLENDVDLLKMTLVYYATMRGTPQFYYGTEILMNNDSAPGDHLIIRTDFPGGWNGDSVNAQSGKGLTEEALMFQSFMRDLLNWRKTRESVHSGDLTHFVPKDGVYVYFRILESESTMVILNKNEEQTPLDLTRFNEVLANYTSAKDALTSKATDLDSITLEAKSARILELNP